MTRIFLLLTVSSCLFSCATGSGEPGFNIGSMELGPGKEVQLRLEKPSAEAVTNNEKMTTELERTRAGKNPDPSGLALRTIWRF